MTYVIVETCIDVKDGACVEVCPVDCIYEGPRMFYIQPDECINCGICESVCPVEAIYYDEDLSAERQIYQEVNAEFFAATVSGLGSPEGAREVAVSAVDHPLVAKQAPRKD